MKKKISIIVPIFNEERGLAHFYKELSKALSGLDYNFEIIFVDDGSSDQSYERLVGLPATAGHKIRRFQLARNFGKEIALTAGINHCTGDACVMLDADLQHPPKLIPAFLQKWQKGSEVVIGVRKSNKNKPLLKKVGSVLYYKMINLISDVKIIPYETDYRLLDRIVIDEFNRLSESRRMTRSLINWLGFDRDCIYFDAPDRSYGEATYSYLGLMRLAFNSIVSLSLLPLKLAGYLGILITASSAGLGLFIIVDKFVFHDPWKFNFTSQSALLIFVLFLVGISLICLGFIALYVASIHIETLQRPLYVIRPEKQARARKRKKGTKKT
jgi:polyisoprenyl-phosphate glycosyltransferase